MTIPEDAIPFGTSEENLRLIERSAYDYMEGWFTGDARRMRRALHPELAKRTLVIDPQSGRPTTALYESDPEQLVCYTEAGGESQWTDISYDPEQGRKNFDVKVLEVYRNVAVARIWSKAYVEYLQLGNFGEAGWKIVNILYAMTEGTAPIDEYRQKDFEFWVVDDAE